MRKGLVIRLQGRDGTLLASRLSGERRRFSASSVSAKLRSELIAGGFLLCESANELAHIRERFRVARHETPMVITVTTTMDCNLGCYYCYESRSSHRLNVTSTADIVQLAEERIVELGAKSLHVDWYGGEPTMNLEFLEVTSIAFQEMCNRLGIRYVASIISNGTCWPEEVDQFVSKHRIRQVQISFDGLKKNHDRRRRFRMGYAPTKDASSFDLAVRLVDRLLECVQVDLRINIDRGNRRDVSKFIEFATKRGWFAKPFSASIQPARLSAYTDRSMFMRRIELSNDEYDAVRREIRQRIGNSVKVEESESPDGFPEPRGSVCAALANASVVVGADLQLYRCGLQVGEHRRSVGTVPSSAPPLSGGLPIVSQPHDDSQWWRDFDPTTLPNCSRCSFLPICWGGCPKKHLDGDSHAIAEQGAYWRKNLARLIAEGVGESLDGDYVFTESHQFRDGVAQPSLATASE
jgi:uncharacterized protein